MLNEFLFTKILKEDIGNIWFQQDAATGHTTVFLKHFLKKSYLADPVYYNRNLVE